jgi:DNA repair protein RecN (Recombination protein N)
LLDDFAQAASLRDETRQAWSALSLAKAERTDLAEKITALAAEEDYLRHTVYELEALEVQSGDESQLDAQRRLMKAAVKIRTDVTKADQALSPQGAEGQITDASRWLAEAAEHLDGQLDAAMTALDGALNMLAQSQQEIDIVLQGLSFNASELEQTEERLFAIRAAARKHAVLPDELPNVAAELSAKLQTLTSGTAGLDALERKVAAAEVVYLQAAERLHGARVSAAGALDQAMAAELAPLKMERAVFKTEITPSDAGPTGTDTVAFTVATNPGAPTGALEKIASGGELSRFLLALKVCLSERALQRTLIFD